MVMSDVRIRMDADPSGLQNALRRAQEDVRKLTEQMRGMGKAGQDFGKIDFGQLPGEMGKHMEKVQKQYRDLLALNNDLRRRLQMSGQEGASPFEIDWDRMGYLNRRTQEEARRRVIEQSARGTPWQPPAGGGGQGGGGSPGAEAGERGGGFGGFAAAGWGGLKMVAGMLGISAGIGVIAQGFKLGRDMAVSTDLFIRRTRDAGETFGSVRDRLKGLGENLQLTDTESAKMATEFAKAANSVDQTGAIDGARGAVGFSRAFGMEPEAGIQGFGMAEFVGATGRGGLTQKQLATLIGRTISEGMYGGRGEQVMVDLGRHMEAITSKTMQAPTDTEAYLRAIEAMGKLAKDPKANLPGLAGYGANLIEAFGSAIRQGQGGVGSDFLRAKMMRDAGEFGQGGRDVWGGLIKMQTMTPFEKLKNGKYAIEQYFETASSAFGGGEQGLYMMSADSGLPAKQIVAMRKVAELMRQIEGEGGGKNVDDMMQAAGVDLAKLNESGLKEVMDIMGARGDTGLLKNIGARYLDRTDVTGDRKETLEKAMNGSDPGALQKALLSIAGTLGMTQTDGTKIQQSIADLISIIQRVIGENLVPAINKLTDLIRGVNDYLKPMAEKYLGIDLSQSTGDKEADDANASIFSGRRWAHEWKQPLFKTQIPEWVQKADNWMNRNDPDHPGGYHDPRDEMIQRARRAAASAAPPMTGDRAEFIRRVTPAAKEAASELGVSPETLIAQSAHETNWGRSAPGNNFFGIKATSKWKGATTSSMTSEHGAGGWRREPASWRAYDRPEDSFRDYINFVKRHGRYSEAVEAGATGDDFGYLQGLQRGGYATDPTYAQKVDRIRKSIQLPATSPGFDANLLRPKPRDDFTPLPEGATPPGASPANDPGRVDIYLHQRDSKGTAVGAPAQHRMDLSQRSPHGSIDVDSLFGATP